MMKSVVPIAPVRWLLATVILVAWASPPIRIGHAHGGAGDHGHQHSAESHDGDHHDDDHGDAHLHDVPALGEHAFHWHDSWLGMTFVTTVPPDGEGYDSTFVTTWLDSAVMASADLTGPGLQLHDWLPPPGFVDLFWDWGLPPVLPIVTPGGHTPAAPIPYVGSVLIRC